MKTKILILSLVISSLPLFAESGGSITHSVNGVTTTTTTLNGKSQTTVQGLTKENTSASTGTKNSFSSSDMAWVDQKIEEIKPQRNGMSNNRLSSLKSPFIIIKKEVKDDDKKASKKSNKTATTDAKNSPLKKDMSKEPLTLQMVLNSSALINGKWLKENEKTRGYTLTQIQSGYVVLERKKKKIKLFISQKTDNLNISTK